MGGAEGDGQAFRIDENGQILLGKKKLLSAAAYPRGLRVQTAELRFDNETGIFSVSLRVSDSGGEVPAGTDFQVKHLNHT